MTYLVKLLMKLEKIKKFPSSFSNTFSQPQKVFSYLIVANEESEVLITWMHTTSVIEQKTTVYVANEINCNKCDCQDHHYRETCMKVLANPQTRRTGIIWDNTFYTIVSDKSRLTPASCYRLLCNKKYFANFVLDQKFYSSSSIENLN